MQKNRSSDGHPPSSPEELFGRALPSMVPNEARDRIKSRMLQRTGDLALFVDVQKTLTPEAAVSSRVWSRIRNRLAMPELASLWEQIRSAFFPTEDLRFAVRRQMMNRLQPAYQPVYVRPLKWAAAFAIVALITASTPLVFLGTPHSIADSPVTVDSAGEFYILSGGLWQPQKHAVLTENASIKTSTTPATIALHGDAVFRLAPNTTIVIHDLSQRPKMLSAVKISLQSGQIWAQGFVSDSLPGITIARGGDRITFNQASVSIADTGTVWVLNRRAKITTPRQNLTLLAGDQYAPNPNDDKLLSKIPDSVYGSEWVKKNLAEDAVHQREIAQMQQERIASQAGILPTSPLYVVKRSLEVVDSALTFDATARTKKILAQANTRLNEAAALLAAGNPDASLPLAEYKQTIVAAASGSSVAQSIIQQELVTASAGISAALPGDPGYPLKQAVLATQAAVTPGSNDAQDQLLVDQVQALNRTVEEQSGKMDPAAAKTLQALQPQLSKLPQTSPDVQDATASLSVIAAAFDTQQTPSKPQVEPAHLPSIVAAPAKPAEIHEPSDPIPAGVVASPENTAMLTGDILYKIQIFSTTSQELIYDEAYQDLQKISDYPAKEDVVEQIKLGLRDSPHVYLAEFLHALLQLKKGGRW